MPVLPASGNLGTTRSISPVNGGADPDRMDSRSREDPAEAIYDARLRGVCLISTRSGTRLHLHGGCWVTVCANRPPRLLVAIPKEFEAAALVETGRRFAVSLVAEDQAELNRALFAGRSPMAAIGRDRFLRAPSGCPVLRDGVGYLDCELADAIDLGDFLLAVGDLRAAAALNPCKRNLTVNEIQQAAMPAQPQLPFQGFDDQGEALAPAPTQGTDTATLQRVYALRAWGSLLVSAATHGCAAMELCNTAIQCSHQPPRMLVCVAGAGRTAAAIRSSGRFVLSLLSSAQRPLTGAQPEPSSGDDPRATGSLGHFVCRVEGEFGAGTDLAAFYGPVEACTRGDGETPPPHPADPLGPTGEER